MSSRFQKIKGFSIVEAAVLLVVGSIMIASYSSLLAKKMQADAINTTKERMDTIKKSIYAFYEVNGKLPCPASQELPLSNGNFGREVSHSNCTGSLAGTQSTGGTEGVRFGAVPVRDLDLPDEMMTDAWGNRFRYAVTEALASAYEYDASKGKLVIKDKDGTHTIRDQAHFAIISLGPNRKGAYNAAGKPPAIICPTTGEAESYNCKAAPTTELRIDLTTSTASVKTGYDDLIIYGPEKLIADIGKTPAHMVAAFKLTTCPDGWSAYAPAIGRVIVGTGNFSETSPGGHVPSWTFPAETYNMHDEGGQARPTLTRSQLPTHKHQEAYEFTMTGQSGGWGRAIGGNPTDDPITEATTTDYAGGGQPYENRQPWIAMLYCEKN